MTPRSSPLLPPALGGLPDWGMSSSGGLFVVSRMVPRRESGYACDHCVSLSHLNLTTPDSACLRSQITFINLGRSRARKIILETPVLGGDMPASPPIGGDPQDLTPPCPNSSWPYALTHSAPIFSGCLAGFLPLVTGADHCQFCTDLEITIIRL